MVGLILLIAGLPNLAQAADFQVTVQPTRYPFLPTLSLNENPELCGAFLNLVTDEFLGTRFEIGVIDRPWYDRFGGNTEWMFGGPSAEPDYVVDSAEVYDRRVDINGDGVTEALVEFVYWPNWRSQKHSLVWFPSSVAFDHLVARISNPYLLLNEAPKPLAESFRPLGVVSHSRDLFVYSEEDYEYYQRNSLSLRHIDSNGSLTPTCTIDVLPNPPRHWVIPGLASFDELYQLLPRIAGGEAACGGTLHSQSTLQQLAAAT